MRKDHEPVVTVTIKGPEPPLEVPNVDLKVNAESRQLVFTFNESGFAKLMEYARNDLEREGALWQIKVS